MLEAVKNRPDKNRSNMVMKRWGYSSIAAVAVFLLFIGSSYFSLGMAKVAAKIPYFSLFIKQEEYYFALRDVIDDVMNENKYEISDLDVSVPNRKISVSLLGSKTEVKSMEKEVEQKLNNELVVQNFGKYDIEIKKGTLPELVTETTAEEEEYFRKSMELEKKVLALLEKNNYTPAFPIEVRMNNMENFMYIALPNTETRVPELKEQLKVLTKEYGEFRYKITSIDMAAREQELRWGKKWSIHILVGGLMENKDFKVTGISYSFHPLPLQIKVKTSVKSTNPEAKKLAEDIENEITEFIQTHEKTAEVRNDPYELLIIVKIRKS